MSASDPERPVARNDADARAPRWRPANGLFIARLPNRLGFRQRQTTVESFRRSLSPAQRHGDCDECHAERNHRQPGPQRRRPGGHRTKRPKKYSNATAAALETLSATLGSSMSASGG